MNASLFSSERPDWNTPQRIVDFVRKFGSGRIALDPCSNENSIVGAEREYRLDRNEDGLKLPWDVDGLVYVNPPYGREIEPWARRCAERHAETIALVPARTDARWFKHCWDADAICFVRGRLRFLGAPASAPFPSALVYWGNYVGCEREFAIACYGADLGHTVLL